MKVLGINAVFHDPAAALVVDGVTVAAVEEERFNRRKHGHDNVPFAAWEVPEKAARWCLKTAGIGADELDAYADVVDALDRRTPDGARERGDDSVRDRVEHGAHCARRVGVAKARPRSTAPLGRRGVPSSR